MELVTKLECSCGWRLRVGGTPAGSGYILERAKCDKAKCGRRWMIIWHIALRPTLLVQVAYVHPDGFGRRAMDLYRALIAARTEINRQRGVRLTELGRGAVVPPEMTEEEVRTMVAVAEAMAAAGPP